MPSLTPDPADPVGPRFASWRIQLGARLLRESNRNVATIALDVGYDSEAAFSRAFKRMVSMPPAAWRKAQAD
jgi:AraC-like DNA-binding protein